MIGPHLPLTSKGLLPWYQDGVKTGNYTIAACELVAEGADLRVQVLSLAVGQSIPGITTARLATVLFALRGRCRSAKLFTRLQESNLPAAGSNRVIGRSLSPSLASVPWPARHRDWDRRTTIAKVIPMLVAPPGSRGSSS